EPLFNIGLAMLATMLFVLFIPLSLGRARRSGTTGQFALGLLLGFSFDTAIHGVYGTYDTVWQSGLLLLLPTLLLVAVQWLLLASYIRTQPEAGADALDVNPWPLLAIGPFFFLELLIFQNIARLAVLTNLVLPAAFAWTLLGHLLALWIATQLLKKPGNLRFPLVIAGGLLLVAVTTLSDAAVVWLSVAALLIGQLTLSILMVAIIMDLGGSSDKAHRSLTAPFGAGMVLLVVLLLGYYASYQISLPFSNTVLPPLAALVMAVCGGLSSRKLSPVIQMKSRLRVVAMLAVPLVLLPLITFGIWQTPGVESGSGYPVRIMTYNLHNGFNTDGRLDMEALARVIEESNPDVVALQEISRGWLISGRLDMLTWLSQRLEMPYISGPTADSLWGNAILSNFPILEYANYELPPRDLPIKRGFTAALIDIGDGQILQVVANHFHHPEEGSAIRQVQSEVIVDFYSGVGSVVYLGDFNAEPDTTEMEMLRNAGLVDSLAGRDDLTFNSDDLYQRIDYIWVS
ncbi:MAG: endonuclease/exonuclease/phosphatase family protein, partial [Gammaproteobacteria bacterium]|nr:endonuclease/exonuclease/phosphatase family protein [Gammaproteobacteria bacterium]